MASFGFSLPSRGEHTTNTTNNTNNNNNRSNSTANITSSSGILGGGGGGGGGAFTSTSFTTSSTSPSSSINNYSNSNSNSSGRSNFIMGSSTSSFTTTNTDSNNTINTNYYYYSKQQNTNNTNTANNTTTSTNAANNAENNRNVNSNNNFSSFGGFNGLGTFFTPINAENEQRFSSRFGIDGLSPRSDSVVSKQVSTKVSPSPIGADSFPKSPSLFNQWETQVPTSSSPSSATTPPQHINNLFGFSSPFSVGVIPPKNTAPNNNGNGAFKDDHNTFNFSSFRRELDTSRPSATSPSLEAPMDDDLFDMDPVDSPISSYAGSPQNVMHSPVGSANANQSAQSDLSGEHPLGEHPSRTLFVRNINSNVEDEELSTLFEQYGPIRSMYTQCKHRGFVMISYYDIRHAKNAMRYLQGKVLRRRKLDIHYSIPKDNPSEKDQNQGTLVVFNLDPATTNDELKHIFGSFGEIKEVRETPNKKHHKFIEFYDIRDADKAMKALNKTEVKGKKIKIEPSRPGGARKTMMNQMVLEQHFTGSVDEDNFLSQPQSLPFMGNTDSNDQSEYSPSTNSYPPVHQTLPKYVPLSPPPQSQSTSPIFRSARPRSQSVTSPMDSPPSSLTAISKSSSSSSLPSVWGPYIPSTDSTPRPYSPSPLDGRPKVGGFSPSSGVPLFDQVLSPTKELKGNADTEIVTRRHRSQSTEEEKSKFTLVIEKVRTGEDVRATLMIKNIPNKYSQKMLLSSIDENYKGTYDFFYLPIDFKNKCNVGYAFINFISPEFIITFYQEFNNKKWEKFNSEKVCELTYARIQGKNALVNHFQNSSLMGEDKKCRPIIFHSDGPFLGEQEPFPVGLSPRRNRSYSNSSREDDLR